MPVVDVRFNLQGDRIAVDHAYSLFSAISKLLPEIHGDGEVGIHSISGRLLGDRCLAIGKGSGLVVRLDSDRIGSVLPLAGKSLHIGEDRIIVGTPGTRALVPAARLYSRLVVIKGFTEPEPFLEAARRQLVDMGVKGEPSLVSTGDAVQRNRDRDGGTRSPWIRRTVRIRDKNIVGFALRVQDLTAEESILVQERGIGGRRRFGCGLFLPDRR